MSMSNQPSTPEIMADKPEDFLSPQQRSRAIAEILCNIAMRDMEDEPLAEDA